MVSHDNIYKLKFLNIIDIQFKDRKDISLRYVFVPQQSEQLVAITYSADSTKYEKYFPDFEKSLKTLKIANPLDVQMMFNQYFQPVSN